MVKFFGSFALLSAGLLLASADPDPRLFDFLKPQPKELRQAICHDYNLVLSRPQKDGDLEFQEGDLLGIAQLYLPFDSGITQCNLRFLDDLLALCSEGEWNPDGLEFAISPQTIERKRPYIIDGKTCRAAFHYRIPKAKVPEVAQVVGTTSGPLTLNNHQPDLSCLIMGANCLRHNHQKPIRQCVSLLH